MHYTWFAAVLPLAAYALPAQSSVEDGLPVDDGSWVDDYPLFGADEPRLTPAAASVAANEGKIPLPGSSKTFQLVVHVMDKSRDQTPTLEGQLAIPLKRGYSSWITEVDDQSYDAIRKSPYFLDSEQPDASQGKGNIITQTMFRGKVLASLSMQHEYPKDNTTFSRVQFYLSKENPTAPALSPLIDPIFRLVENEYLSCSDESSKTRVRNLDTSKGDKIPDNCIRIRIFPECIPDDQVDKRFKPRIEAAPFIRCYQPGGDYSIFDWL